MNWGRVGVAALAVVGVVLSSCASDKKSDEVAPALSGIVWNGETSKPAADIAVTLGDVTVTTDAEGRFAFASAPGEFVLSAQNPSFTDGFAKVTVSEAGSTYTSLVVWPLGEAQRATVTLGDNGAAVEFADGTRVEIPPGALVNANGDAVTGDVDVSMRFLSGSDALQAPGSSVTIREDGTEGLLGRLGAFDLVVSQGGERLQVAEEQELGVLLPTTIDTVGKTPAVVASFDPATGEWKEEGQAARIKIGDQAYYDLLLPHLSYWAAGEYVGDVSCGKICVVDEDGAPVEGALAGAFGAGTVGGDETGIDGCAEFTVPASTHVQVGASAPDGRTATSTATTGADASCTLLATLTLEAAGATVECPTGKVACGESCVTLDTTENCGACGTSCSADQICGDGMCQSDYCAGNPCKNGASCKSGETTFECTCDADYQGVTCEDKIPSPTPGMRDSFETGDTSRATTTVDEAGGASVSVTSDCNRSGTATGAKCEGDGLDGPCGLKVSSDSSVEAAYVAYSTDKLKEARVEFILDPNSDSAPHGEGGDLDMAGGQNVRFLKMISSFPKPPNASSVEHVIGFIKRNFMDDNYRVRIMAQQNFGFFTTCAEFFFALDDGPSKRLTVEWVQGTGPQGSQNGRCSVYMDGVLQGEKTNVNNSEFNVSEVRFGFFQPSVPATTTGSFCIDDITIGNPPDDTCDGKVCDMPSAQACKDATTLTSYATEGTCGAGECSYEATDTNCAVSKTSCVGNTLTQYDVGSCSADACAPGAVVDEIDCDVLPAAMCEGGQLATFSAGACNDATDRCDFTKALADCTKAPTCEGTDVVTWSGSCPDQAGACAFTEATRTACADSGQICIAGACADAPPSSGSCGEGQYSCNFGLGDCIPNSQLCDGIDQCGTGVPDDEDPAICGGNCTADQYACGGDCFANTTWCDGTNDCIDGADEAGCCTAPEIWCAANKTCLGESLQCNGTEECSSGHDESAFVCGGCQPGEYSCGNDFGRCISASKLCDGNDDCGSGYADDEGAFLCGMGSCAPTGEFACDTSQCLPTSAYCDGTADCQDGSDEPLWCGGGGGGGGCQAGEFACDDGGCIPAALQCNGSPECIDGSDEVGCGGGGGGGCQAGEFECDGGTCLPIALQCNGPTDCLDGTDEVGCGGGGGGCQAGELECLDGGCVPIEFQCNGFPDCIDASDETGCGP